MWKFPDCQGPLATVFVLITDLSESRVILDANYFLAGQDLIFDIELVEIA
jgi:FKBP-type peptidyl-prolyl cis-trans isomerase 2